MNHQTRLIGRGWFCVLKRIKEALRLVHSLEPLNAITIRHSGVPPIPIQHGEQFADIMRCNFDLYCGI